MATMLIEPCCYMYLRFERRVEETKTKLETVRYERVKLSGIKLLEFLVPQEFRNRVNVEISKLRNIQNFTVLNRVLSHSVEVDSCVTRAATSEPLM